MKLSLATLALCLFTSVASGQIVQVKVCNNGPPPCWFDLPVTPGDLIVGPHVSGSVPSDTQGDVWHNALVVPNWNGASLDYALNVHGGMTGVWFTSDTWWAIIAEYPPSTGFDKGNWGTYTYNNSSLGAQNGGNYDAGWTYPIETEEPCELLVAWGVSGTYDNSTVHGIYHPIAGPGFTVREYEFNILGLEDRWATTPGIYIGVMNWNVSAHWDLGLAAFKMGGCH